MLRRLIVDGDEKHDYLSRGATLQIRDQGVYAVYGTEDRGRVEWKFEYLVTSRISPTTGEEVPNEKVRSVSAPKVMVLSGSTGGRPPWLLRLAKLLQSRPRAQDTSPQRVQEDAHAQHRLREEQNTAHRQTPSGTKSRRIHRADARKGDPYDRSDRQSRHRRLIGNDDAGQFLAHRRSTQIRLKRTGGIFTSRLALAYANGE